MLLASQFTDCHVSKVHGLILHRYWTNTPAKAALSSTAAPPAKSDGSRVGSTSMFSKLVQRRLDEHPEKCASGARRLSILSGRSKPDGSDPLSDEDAAPCGHRDGATRPHLQSHARHEHHGTWTVDFGDPSDKVKTISAVATTPDTTGRHDPSETAKSPQPVERLGRSASDPPPVKWSTLSYGFC